MVPLVLKDLGASYSRMTGPSTVAIDLLARPTGGDCRRRTLIVL